MKHADKNTSRDLTGNKEENIEDFKQDRIGDIEDKGAEGLYLTDVKPKSRQGRGSTQDKMHFDLDGYMEG